ncbi:MAG: hypothetical protein ACKOAD_05760, partial [Gammaproteobacteria bacterium]
KTIDAIEICLNNKNSNIRYAAVLAIAHISRTHEKLPEKKIIDLLKKASQDESAGVSSQVQIALDDIKVYMPSLFLKINFLYDKK